MRLSRVLLPSVLALFPIIVSAAPQTRERTTVEVVQVPVSVTKDGSAVRGLTRDDFTLRVNGKAQPIDYKDTTLLRKYTDRHFLTLEEGLARIAAEG